ncbi:type II toxin-antitoxin system Phd/YefM family antitoxin [Patescibacteria group bacterium]|nr:type II toxin-antitoxin system Phd/YefM family antitoxin [Patescibacteria group bacterium]
MSLIPKLTSAVAIQRSYKKVIEAVKETKEPVIILRRNKPEAAIIDIETFEELSRKAESYDELRALESIEQSEREFKSGKTKVLKSLKDLR